MFTTEQIWDAIVEQRLALGEQLSGLSEQEWNTPSWCSDWTVKECAAHVIQAPQVTWRVTGRIFLGMLRHGYSGAIAQEGHRRGLLPTADLLAEYQRWSPVRRGPVTVTKFEPLIDILVHSQDILQPLGRQHTMPVEAAATAADRARTLAFMMGGAHLRRRHLVATDIDWEAGPPRGPEVSGPISDILLALCGRPNGLVIPTPVS